MARIRVHYFKTKIILKLKTKIFLMNIFKYYLAGPDEWTPCSTTPLFWR